VVAFPEEGIDAVIRRTARWLADVLGAGLVGLGSALVLEGLALAPRRLRPLAATVLLAAARQGVTSYERDVLTKMARQLADTTEPRT